MFVSPTGEYTISFQLTLQSCTYLSEGAESTGGNVFKSKVYIVVVKAVAQCIQCKKERYTRNRIFLTEYVSAEIIAMKAMTSTGGTK